MKDFLEQNSVKLLALVFLTITGFLTYFHFFKNPSSLKGPEALMIENKGLTEFNAENDTIDKVSLEEKQIAVDMSFIFREIGGGKDYVKNKEAILKLDKVIEKYKEYPDAYFLRATISVSVGFDDYKKILSDIDNAIRFSPSAKYSITYGSLSSMYGMRAKVDILTGDYRQAVNDLENAVKADPDNTNTIFNNSGVKPDVDSNIAAIQKKDLDLLIAKYPDDYRVYLFRGLFYGSFTIYDEKYFALANQDLKQALKINPQSALASFLLGKSGQEIGFWTKAAWSDASDITDTKGGFKDQVHKIALSYFKEAIRLDPQFAEAYYQAAESLYSLERYSESIPYYDRAIEINPNKEEVYNDRGLAKTHIGDYYTAIDDFSKAIQLNKMDKSFLENSYENRANAYMKASDYDEAISDYSRAIGLKLANMVFIMSLSQVRSLYPELNDISDNDLLRGIQQKFFPDTGFAEFADNYKDDTKKIGCNFILADLYSNRADAYVSKGNFKRAVREYARVNNCDEKYAATLDRWKTVIRTPDTEYFIDTQTLDFSQDNIVSLWVKILNTSDQSYFKTNFQINCLERKIKSLSVTKYSLAGSITGTIPPQDWESIIPETISEVLYSGMCTNK